MFETLHRRMGKTGVPQHHVGRLRHNVDREKEILDIVHETLSISVFDIMYHANIPSDSLENIEQTRFTSMSFAIRVRVTTVRLSVSSRVL